MPFHGGLRELDPIYRKPQPSLFVGLADGLLRLFAAFLGVLAEPLGICLGHGAEIMHKVKSRPLHFSKPAAEVGNRPALSAA
jgi:hypothetical protein